jgi:hypothetical protein
MLHTKQDRAQRIVSMILALDEQIGSTIPAGTVISRIVQNDPRWHARLISDHRVTIGRLNEHDVGHRRLSDVGWRLFELYVRDRLVLVANLRGPDVHLHSYVPGIWESWLGVDNGGDTVPLDCLPFADPKNAEWQAVQQTADFQLAPQREQPREDKVGENPFRRRSRRKRLG